MKVSAVSLHDLIRIDTRTIIQAVCEFNGGEEKIAMWLPDFDYSGHNPIPRSVLLPMPGDIEAWPRLVHNLKAERFEDLIDADRGTVSLPFEVGDRQRIAVEIVHDRGLESLRIVSM